MRKTLWDEHYLLVSAVWLWRGSPSARCNGSENAMIGSFGSELFRMFFKNQGFLKKLLFCFYYFSVPGIESRASHMLGRCFTLNCTLALERADSLVTEWKSFEGLHECIIHTHVDQLVQQRQWETLAFRKGSVKASKDPCLSVNSKLHSWGMKNSFYKIALEI